MAGAPGNQSFAEGLSVTANGDADAEILLSAVLINSAVCVGCAIAFSVLRRLFPRTYSNNALEGRAAAVDRKADGPRGLAALPSLFSWVKDSYGVTNARAVQVAGLDSALLLEFSELGLRLAGVLCVPLLLVLLPLHAAAGGGAAGSDRLSVLDMGNVVIHHPWLYYVHAVVVWGVCFVVRGFLFQAQAKFLKMRFEWLLGLPAPRATTILFANIPRTYRSVSQVTVFLSGIFSDDAVQEVNFVKHTSALASMVQAQERAKELGRKAELRAEKDGVRPTHRVRPSLAEPSGKQVDSISHYAEERQALQGRIEAERKRIVTEGDSLSSGINSPCAFVTFATRHQAEMARDLRFSANCKLWQVSSPPEPSAIRWQALLADPNRSALMKTFGYALIVALYLFFTPLCALITSAATTVDAGPLQPVWGALAPTLGLRLMLMLLPTILLTTFRLLFALRSDPEAQHHLQAWFFAFEFIFVILVTAVSTSLVDTIEQLAKQPMSVFDLLAAKMPDATHFYMNYLVLSWSTYSFMLLRVGNLVKFLVFKAALYTEEEAFQKAEPESQDSDGMGVRCTELSISVCILLIFSTLSPLVAPIAAVSFALSRITFGYLVVFAETRKPDLGGEFWVTQLGHVQLGLALYCSLMIGVLASRAATCWPAVVAAPSLALVLWTFLDLRRSFDWTRVPFDELLRAEGAEALGQGACGEPRGGAYVQPELLEAPGLEEAGVPL